MLTDKDLDLFSKSEFVEVITSMMEQDYGKRPIISRCHPIRAGNGNILFYVITKGDNNHFLIDIVGKKVQTDELIYWIENINHAGKLHEIYYERDLIVVTFFRGEKFNNEYLSYFYVYGDRYPAVRFVPQETYNNYSFMLSKRYKKLDINLPDDLIYKKENNTIENKS